MIGGPNSRDQAVGGAFGRLYGGADAAKHPGVVKSQMCFSWIESWAGKERLIERLSVLSGSLRKSKCM